MRHIYIRGIMGIRFFLIYMFPRGGSSGNLGLAGGGKIKGSLVQPHPYRRRGL